MEGILLACRFGFSIVFLQIIKFKGSWLCKYLHSVPWRLCKFLSSFICSSAWCIRPSDEPPVAGEIVQARGSQPLPERGCITCNPRGALDSLEILLGRPPKLETASMNNLYDWCWVECHTSQPFTRGTLLR